MKSLITVSLTMLMLVTGRSVAGQNDSKPPITIALTVETPTAKTGATVSIRAVLTNNSKQPLDASGCLLRSIWA